MTPPLNEIYERLFERFGPQGWWPGAAGPFEVMVGAVLAQNTAWTNVERAIRNLLEADALNAGAINGLSQAELEELVQPAGYFRVKARRLRNLVDWLFRRYDGSVEAMFATDIATLREELLGINGIGPETADSILLYAGYLPSFVIDAYTHRVWKRHGWIEPEADYHAIKAHFEERLEPDAVLYNEFHALIVRVGNEHCRKRPRCDACPLAELLPEGGPIAPPE
jgi:endonuclease-3 related protein